MNPLVASLAHSLWQAGLLWVLVWLTLRRLPARRPVVRYRVALAGLLLAVLAWLVTWALLARPVTSSEHIVPLSVSERLSTMLEEMRGNTVLVTSSTASTPLSSAPGYLRELAMMTWQEWVQLAWMAGVLLGFLRMARAMAYSKKLQRTATPLTQEAWLRELELATGMLRCRTRILLRQSAKVLSPVVAGLWQPVIIIPAALVAGVPTDVMRAALAHEVAHVVRRDLLVHLLQMATEAILFFNPFIWLLNRAVREEREACCDEMVSPWCGGAAQYSSSLVWWTRTVGDAMPVPAGVLAMKGPGAWLRERVERLLNPSHIPKLRSGWPLAMGTTLLVALTFVLMAGSIHLTVAQLSPRERVEFIEHLAAPYRDKGYQDATAATTQLREFSGVVVDEDGQVLPKASWTVAWPPDLRRRDGSTDEHGKFQGSIEENSRVLLRVLARGFAEHTQTFEQGSMKDLRIVMKQGVDFTVKCVDVSGAPLPGVRTTLRYEDGHKVLISTSDAQGLASFQHVPEQRPAELVFTAPGYLSLQVENVVTDAQANATPRAFTLEKAEPVEIAFVDEKDGTPVAGVQCRSVERQPQLPNTPWPAYTVANAEGRAVLHGLHPAITYGFKGELQNRSVLFTVASAKEKKMTVHVPRERLLKFKVINLPPAQHTVEVQYSQRDSIGGSSNSRRVVGYPTNGAMELVLGGLTKEAPVQVHLLRQWFRSPVLEEEISEYTLDYAKEGRAPEVPVVVRFDAGRGGATPGGKVFLIWNTPDLGGNWDGFSVPIKDGRAEFSLPGGARVKFRHSSMLGGRVDEEKEYTITGNDTELVVPVTPAGMARMKVLDATGALLKMDQLVVRNHSRENADVEMGTRPDLAPRTWQVSAPLAFGDKYDVVAIRGLQTVISPVFKLRPGQPVQDVELHFPTPATHRITVVDEAGQPVPDLACVAQYAVPGRQHQVASAHLQTDRAGQLTLEYLPEQARGSFTLRAWSGPYVPSPEPLDIAGHQATLTVKRGRAVRGRLLDRATDKGVRGADVRWQADSGMYGSLRVTSDEEGRFEFLNAPADRVFLQIYKPDGSPAGKSWKGNFYAEPGAGESVFYLE